VRIGYNKNAEGLFRLVRHVCTISLNSDN
jgi:hypothetical protein